MFISIHQPEFMPWTGFFDKIAATERFVILDSVKFQKNYFINRCRIKQNGEPHWVTVPVVRGPSDDPISAKQIASGPWGAKAYKAFLYNYNRSPYWADHEPFLDAIFNRRRWERLAELNLAVISYVCEYLGLRFEFVLSSGMGLDLAGSDLILAICRRVGADRYLSGANGVEYLSLEAFAAAGIRVEFQKYRPPAYTQFNGPYCGPLSIMDLLLNHGRRSRDVLASGRET